MLTLDFNKPVRASDLGGKTPFFQTGTKPNPLDLMNHREETKRTENNIIKWLKFKGFKHNAEWDIVEKQILTKQKFDYTHSITLNKDMKKFTYGELRERNEFECQMFNLLSIIDEFSSGIKKLILVYEYGSRGKLHWHMCAKLKNARKLKKALQESFGTNEHAVWFKNIKPNTGETMMEMKDNIINYYKKEKHNEIQCYICK